METVCGAALVPVLDSFNSIVSKVGVFLNGGNPEPHLGTLLGVYCRLRTEKADILIAYRAESQASRWLYPRLAVKINLLYNQSEHCVWVTILTYEY
jgi:hypothetical protein